jgi:asparagine N-glycosylation enzyme membrane subunit Stt3
MNDQLKKYSTLIDSNKEREELDGYTTEDETFIMSYLTLRKAIGLLGISLPILCLLGSLRYENNILPSISHYYHSTVNIFFASILFLLAIFLWTYNGDDKYERAICKTLAIMALLIVFFPTTNSVCIPKPCYTESDLRSFVMPAIVGKPWIGRIHLFCAFIFFSLLVILIFFKFIIHERKQSSPDIVAIRIYKVCGWGMILSITGIGLAMIFAKNSDNWTLPPTFMFESIALVCFGVSWLTKGETFRRN